MWQPQVSPLGSIGLSALVAFLPLLWLLFSLGYMKMAAHKACFISLIVSAIIAVVGWHMPAPFVLTSTLEGIVLAVWPILWVIVAAIFTYNVTMATGAMDKIKGLMSSLSGDRRIQALLIAWGFGAFLEAAAGFGTAVAIPTAILIGLGFNPFFASIICLIANTVPVAFGAVGLPVVTLAQVADLNLMQLTYDIALQLTPFVVLIPFGLVLILTKSLKGLKGVMGVALAAGLGFAIPQLLVARFVGPELTAILGSVVSMACVALMAKFSPPKEEWRFPNEEKSERRSVIDTTFTEQIVAWSPYILLFIFILGSSSLVPPIAKLLGSVKSVVSIYEGPGGKPYAIQWLATPGTMIFLAAIIGGLIQGASLSKLLKLFGQTLVQLTKTAATVASIVAMAKVMGYSGMVSGIATALASLAGPFFPLIAPLIGALGTFVTGSDTSANVLFGGLQKQTALQIGADPHWVAAANTAGATAGKMISPQSIAVATSATGQGGNEGDILRVTIVYCLIYVVVLGIVVYAFSY
jgi:lactate permease